MIEYRGFRIDPQSRRIMDKPQSEWRARAVVHSSTEDAGTAHPIESPSIHPTEEDANAVAVEVAKEWIDRVLGAKV